MTPIVLSDATSGSTARIAPRLGFNCFEFTARFGDWSVNVLDADPAFADGALRSSGHGLPILFPFPNRIRDSRYSWGGRDYVIPPEVGLHDKLGHAIHGFCLDQAWRVIEQSPRHCIGQFQLSVDAPARRALWPADFVIEVRYELRGASLRADIRIENPDTVPLPWGFGTHPYFRLPLEAASAPSRCLIQVPAASEWVLENCLPTGEQRPVEVGATDLRDGEYVDVLKLDHVLTDLEANKVLLSSRRPGIRADPASAFFIETQIVDEAAGLQVVQRFGGEFRECVVFTPPNRSCVCIEPYTCVTDAIHLQANGVDAGLNVLAPGKSVRLWFEITAGTLLC